MTSILETIVASKRRELAAAKERLPESELRRRLADAPPTRPFRERLEGASGVGIIAEIKKASPSAGVLRDDFDPVVIARIYADHGASCLSVLTDEPFFQGRLEFLAAIRETVNIPLLRKDFIVDPYQLLEARAAGADAVLLIAEILPVAELKSLHDQAKDSAWKLWSSSTTARNWSGSWPQVPGSSASTIVTCGRSKPGWNTRSNSPRMFPRTAVWSAKAVSVAGPTSSASAPPASRQSWSGSR